ncbi:MAG: prepilin peptidase [Parasporobacterium sp.]|nr:prepilin peptidase [Parasporobacterium sp.]
MTEFLNNALPDIIMALLLLLLLAAAMTDFRYKAIPWWLGAGGTALGVALHIWLNELKIWELLAGLALGGIVMLLSRLTRDGIGFGDGLMVMTTGAFLGITGNVVLLGCSFLLSSLAAIFCLVFRKKKRKDTLPFIPFMLGGYVVMLAVFI